MPFIPLTKRDDRDTIFIVHLESFNLIVFIIKPIAQKREVLKEIKDGPC